jgi:DNA-binding CsgD family transcriptional regulator
MSRVDTIHRAIRRVYEAALAPDDWPDAIASIAHAADAPKAMLHADSNHAPSLALPFGFDTDQARRLQQEFELRMPDWIGAIPVGRAMRQSSFISDADFRRSAIYRQAIRPLNGFYGIVAPLVRYPDRNILFSAGRDLGASNFSDDELDAVNLIVPHLTTALKVRNRLAAADMRASGACEIIAQLDMGVILIDAALRPVFVNHRADALARERDGLLLATRGVSASSMQDTHRLNAMIEAAIRLNDAGRGAAYAAIRPRAPTRCALSRKPPRPPLIARIVPVSPSTALDGMGSSPRAALFVIEPDRAVRVDEGLLEETFQLTRREAALAALLARGADLTEAATRAGIGTGTARGYLKQILAKTDTHRQAELVSLILRSGLQFMQ